MADPDFDKVAWSTIWPIDKIVYRSPEITITNSGETGGSYQQAHIVTDSIAHGLGRRMFVRAVWSIDGVNWYSTGSRLKYTFAVNYNGEFGSFSSSLSGLRAAVSVGVSATHVHFVTANGYHGDVAQDDVSESYSPISQNFRIKYALFEVE